MFPNNERVCSLVRFGCDPDGVAVVVHLHGLRGEVVVSQHQWREHPLLHTCRAVNENKLYLTAQSCPFYAQKQTFFFSVIVRLICIIMLLSPDLGILMGLCLLPSLHSCSQCRGPCLSYRHRSQCSLHSCSQCRGPCLS